MDVRSRINAVAGLGVLLALMALTAMAQDLLPVPALTARVIDQTGTLGEAQHAALEAKLAAFEAESGPQIVVLMVPTTAPEDIAAYANRVASAWKIGRRDVGDGLLIVVAKNDRAVRIEVARALEGAVPDLAAKKIIDDAIVPAFRAGDFHAGLDRALDLLMKRVRGGVLPAPTSRTDWQAAPLLAGAVLLTIIGAMAGDVRRGSIPFVTIASAPLSLMAAYFSGVAGSTGELLLAIPIGAAYVLGIAWLMQRLRERLNVRSKGPGSGWSERWGGPSTSSNDSSSSSGGSIGSDNDKGGGFSSGGGGSFGGGGASGRW